jgi:hypothetical protein
MLSKGSFRPLSGTTKRTASSSRNDGTSISHGTETQSSVEVSRSPHPTGKADPSNRQAAREGNLHPQCHDQSRFLGPMSGKGKGAPATLFSRRTHTGTRQPRNDDGKFTSRGSTPAKPSEAKPLIRWGQTQARNATVGAAPQTGTLRHAEPSSAKASPPKTRPGTRVAASPAIPHSTSENSIDMINSQVQLSPDWIILEKNQPPRVIKRTDLIPRQERETQSIATSQRSTQTEDWWEASVFKALGITGPSTNTAAAAMRASIAHSEAEHKGSNG